MIVRVLRVVAVVLCLVPATVSVVSSYTGLLFGWNGTGRVSMLVPWWLIPLGLAYPLWILVRHVHRTETRRVRRRLGLCRDCGYNLTGNESGVCPECGTAVVQGIQPKDE